jgi:hypothetical protein
MMLYKIVLVLVIFGAVTGIINSSGFYPVKLPDSGIKGMSQAQVTDLSNAATSTPANPFSAFVLLQTLVGVLISTFTAVIVVAPLLIAYGCPVALAAGIQVVIWLIMAMGIYQMYTGHQSPGMD